MISDRGSATPLVSIITPTYQHASYIEDCLASVLLQSFTDWELILVDDGSVDDTVERAGRVRDSRIRIVRRGRVGIERLAETYNAGLAECRGTYVSALEGDDRWRAGKLALQLAVMRDPSVVLTYARYATIGSHGGVLAVPPLAGPTRSGPFQALGPLLLESFVELGTTLIRRDALERVGGFLQLPGHRHVDYATFVSLAELGMFVRGDQVVAEWRRHSGSYTVQAVNFPWNFEGPRLCLEFAIKVRRRNEDRPDLPDEPTIKASWSRVLARRYWQGGRILSAQRQWGEARGLFLKGLRVGDAGLRERILLLAGIVASMLRIDLGRFGRLMRRGASWSDL